MNETGLKRKAIDQSNNRRDSTPVRSNLGSHVGPAATVRQGSTGNLSSAEARKEASKYHNNTTTTMSAFNNSPVSSVQDMPIQGQLDYYKAKLIVLAKAHAALLATVDLKRPKQKPTDASSAIRPTDTGSGIVEEEIIEETGEEEEDLVSYSQLSIFEDASPDHSSSSLLPPPPKRLMRNDRNSTPLVDNTSLSKFPLVQQSNEAGMEMLSQDTIETIQIPLSEWTNFADLLQDTFADCSKFVEDLLVNIDDAEENAPSLATWQEKIDTPTVTGNSDIPIPPSSQSLDGGLLSQLDYLDGLSQDTVACQIADQLAVVPPSLPEAKVHVRVGVGVLVKDPRNPHKVFAGTRLNSHGSGTIALPGGHLEMYESWEGCAIREVKEETNLDIHHVTYGHVTNDPMVAEGKHYITIFMMAEVIVPQNRRHHESAFTPVNMEPHKCAGWSSYSWEDLCRLNTERKLFGPLRHLVTEQPATILDFLGKGVGPREEQASSYVI